jgi:antitoxin FitA
MGGGPCWRRLGGRQNRCLFSRRQPFGSARTRGIQHSVHSLLLPVSLPGQSAAETHACLGLNLAERNHGRRAATTLEPVALFPPASWSIGAPVATCHHFVHRQTTAEDFVSGDQGTVDMRFTCKHAHHMPIMVQIRNVPTELHRELKARAALEGMSLSDYLLRELRHALDRPTLDEIRKRLSRRQAVRPHPAPAAAVRAERKSR